MPHLVRIEIARRPHGLALRRVRAGRLLDACDEQGPMKLHPAWLGYGANPFELLVATGTPASEQQRLQTFYDTLDPPVVCHHVHAHPEP